ncbi:hypothetical protein IAU59_003100 [Kwoniella sp. CBS 9459]
MPIASEGSASPPMRQPSLEPERDEAGPSRKKSTNSVVDQQRRQVEKLLANPERNIQLPTATKEKTLRAPREMMKNVQGSSAGAGSGEFHVYKQSRRREYERLKIMDEKARAEEERAAFLARQAEREAAAEAKTSKNRAKRQKRKAGRSGSAKDDPSASASNPNGSNGNGAAASAGGIGKRKLEGGAKVVFKRPGEQDEQSEDEEASDGQEEVGPTQESAVGVPEVGQDEGPRALEEPKITIVDED